MGKHILSIVAAALVSALLVSCATTEAKDGGDKQQAVISKTTVHAANDLYYHIDGIDSYLSTRYGEKIRRTEFDTSTEDMTFTIRSGELQSIILGEWNTQYQFHGLKVGDSAKAAGSRLGTDFAESARSSAADGLRIFTDKNNPSYFLEIDFDDDGTIYLIKYAHTSLDR